MYSPDNNNNINNNLDPAKELRKLWNMRVTVTPFVAGALGTVSKGFERKLEEQKMQESRPYRL